MTRDIVDLGPIVGGDTRARLLEAGLRLFASRGFDSVTTRQLTKAAGVNIAAIGYHFGGKQELYRAVIEQQVAETEPILGPVMARLQDRLNAAKGDRKALAEVAAGLTDELLRAFTGDERMRVRAALILREYAHPSDAFDILFKGRIEPLHKAVTALAAAAVGGDPEDPECVMRGHAVVGQIIVFFIARVVLWARLGWEDYTPERLATVRAVVTASVLASLGLPAPEESS
jgi:AcrR family transcriptional regulator